MSKRLLSHIRRLSHHAETIAAACRTIEREIGAAQMLARPVDERVVERKVRTIESRAEQMAALIGVYPRNVL